jgi:hypothetical protein
MVSMAHDRRQQVEMGYLQDIGGYLQDICGIFAGWDGMGWDMIDMNFVHIGQP